MACTLYLYGRGNDFQVRLSNKEKLVDNLLPILRACGIGIAIMILAGLALRLIAQQFASDYDSTQDSWSEVFTYIFHYIGTGALFVAAITALYALVKLVTYFVT